MKTLTKTSYWMLLQTAVKSNLSEAQFEDLEENFVLFCEETYTLYHKYNCMRKVLHCFNFTKCQLQSMLEEIGQRGQIKIIAWIKKTILFLEEEIKTTYLELQYPHTRSNDRKNHKSSLYLSKEYKPISLMEILTGLQAIEIFVRRDGQPAGIRNITEEFEWLLNTKIPNPEQNRVCVLERKHPTPCLDSMRNAIIDLSER